MLVEENNDANLFQISNIVKNIPRMAYFGIITFPIMAKGDFDSVIATTFIMIPVKYIIDDLYNYWRFGYIIPLNKNISSVITEILFGEL